MNKKIKIFLISLIFSGGRSLSAAELEFNQQRQYVNTKILILSPHGFFYDSKQTRPLDFIKILPEINPENMVMITSKASKIPNKDYIELVEEYNSLADETFSCFPCISIIAPPQPKKPRLRVIAVDPYDPVSPALSLDAQETKVDMQISNIRKNGFAFDKIIFFHEYDVLRAFKYDPELKLNTALYEKLLCYRSKEAMYSHIHKYNQKITEESKKIPIPKYVSIKTLFDFENLKDSIEKGDFHISFPLVIKPTFGVSSQNTHILTSKDEWDNFVTQDYPKHYQISFENQIAPKAAIMIVQEFVADDPYTHVAPMYHIDSLIKPNSQGKILWSYPSAYVSTPHDTTLGKPVGDHTLSPYNPDTIDLLEFNKKVLGALPYIPSIAASHLEVFRKSDGTIFFCEKAARPGGHLISDTMEAASGFHICEQMFRLQAGLTPNCNLPTTPSHLAGAIIFPQIDHTDNLDCLINLYGNTQEAETHLNNIMTRVMGHPQQTEPKEKETYENSVFNPDFTEIEHKDHEISEFDDEYYIKINNLTDVTNLENNLDKLSISIKNTH